MKTIRELTLEEFALPLKLDVQGGFSVTKAALPHLEKTKGNIVYLSSMSGKEIVDKISR